MQSKISPAWLRKQLDLQSKISPAIEACFLRPCSQADLSLSPDLIDLGLPTLRRTARRNKHRQCWSLESTFAQPVAQPKHPLRVDGRSWLHPVILYSASMPLCELTSAENARKEPPPSNNLPPQSVLMLAPPVVGCFGFVR